MKVVHLVLSNAFAGIEQHVDELLSNKLNDKPIPVSYTHLTLPTKA